MYIKKKKIMKKLVIISGVTGAIGNALLAEYGKQKDTVVYGISRQALNSLSFINPQTGKIYSRTLVCSMSGNNENGYKEFINLIDFSIFAEVIYVHALGLYPFEVNEQGEHVISHDEDGDGIDDRCTYLTYNLFRLVSLEIIMHATCHVSCVIFGSLADKFVPLAHKSWCQTIGKVKNYMKEIANNKITMLLLNISSVICSHELISRPFVFINTDADHSYWLTPWEISKKVIKETKRVNGYYHEKELFNFNPGFEADYYQDRKFTPRKIAELFK